jgi:hypothetical protein
VSLYTGQPLHSVTCTSVELQPEGFSLLSGCNTRTSELCSTNDATYCHEHHVSSTRVDSRLVQQMRQAPGDQMTSRRHSAVSCSSTRFVVVSVHVRGSCFERFKPIMQQQRDQCGAPHCERQGEPCHRSWANSPCVLSHTQPAQTTTQALPFLFNGFLLHQHLYRRLLDPALGLYM